MNRFFIPFEDHDLRRYYSTEEIALFDNRGWFFGANHFIFQWFFDLPGDLQTYQCEFKIGETVIYHTGRRVSLEQVASVAYTRDPYLLQPNLNAPWVMKKKRKTEKAQWRWARRHINEAVRWAWAMSDEEILGRLVMEKLK